MSQQARRRDPYPWTWEVPAGVVVMILLVLVCGIHLGRAIANVLAGAGWALPGRIELFRSLPEVLLGDAGAGLTGVGGRDRADAHCCLCVSAKGGAGPVGTGANERNGDLS
jgi:hypothetical protein